MITRLSHPFAAFFARNGFVASSDPLLVVPDRGEREDPLLDGSGGNGARSGSRSRNAA